MDLLFLALAALVAISLAITYWPFIVLGLIGYCIAKPGTFTAIMSSATDALTSDVAVIAFFIVLVVFYFIGKHKDARKGAWSGRPTITGHCHVYVIADGFCHKVGIANDVDRRLATLQTGHPNKLKLVRSFTLPSRELALATEREAHRRLDAYRVGGEWFACEHERAEQAVIASARHHGVNLTGETDVDQAKRHGSAFLGWLFPVKA